MSRYFNIGSTWVAIAQSEVAKADRYVLQIANAAANIVPPVINPVFPTAPSAPPITVPDQPTFQDVVWELPDLPNAFTGSLNVDGLLPEPFDGQPPELNFAAPPVPFSENMPSAPGINTYWEEPELEVNLPAPPSLLSVTTRPFSGLSFPTISTDTPELTVVAPTVREYIPGSQYTSALLSAAQSTLQRFIVDGGTALPPAVEQALWDRAREREYRQAADAIDDLERMESLGYAFPPGVYVNARVKINTELAYTASMLSRDIAIEQAKLEQENVKFALQSAIQLEGQMIQYTNQIEQRAFESVKYATEAGVAIYNARVQAYTAYLDAYKTKVAIYEAQVRGEMAKVDAYKAEIEAERVKADINTALVQQYKVQIDAALSNIEVYKAEIAGIQTKAQIEQLKIQIFGEQVRAYATKVNAYTAGVEGFRAQIQAEGAKQEAFRSQVQAYSAQVDAAAKVAEAKIEEFKGLLGAKQTEWEGYKAAAQAQTSKVQAISAINQTIADAYRSETTAVAAYNDVLTKQWQASVEQAQRVAEIGVAAGKAQAEAYISARTLSIEAIKAGAQVSAQIGAAALNSANWNYTSGLSESWSHADSVSDSTSRSVSDVNQVSRSDSVNRSYSSSDSFNRSISDNTSRATSNSTNYSQSDAFQRSISDSNSTSTSYSNSQSVSDARQVVDSTSRSTSDATQVVQSTSTSDNTNKNYIYSENFNLSIGGG